MPKIKTSELSGAALNEAVTRVVFGVGCLELDVQGTPWNYCGDWSLCGWLIQKFGVWLSDDDEGEGRFWVASVGGGYMQYADEPQEAICRAIVACKLGDEVDIPEELV